MLERQVVYDLFLMQAAQFTKVAYDSHKQKSYRVNQFQVISEYLMSPTKC